jgi:hypothetical protein
MLAGSIQTGSVFMSECFTAITFSRKSSLFLRSVSSWFMVSQEINRAQS